MENILNILSEIKPDVDFAPDTELVDSGILTSFDIIRLVNELNNEFDIEITPLHIVKENFKDALSIKKLVDKLIDED